jgi:uncharacterized protein
MMEAKSKARPVRRGLDYFKQAVKPPDVMKPFRLLVALLLALDWLPSVIAQESTSAAGHWEGAITLPDTELAIRVDLEKAADVWAGTIDIPVQALRGFKLGDVRVKDAEVSFSMPGIPGDPGFTGKLDADAKTLRGDFTQGGRPFPFELERKAKPVSSTGETPVKGVPGQGLAGHWQGSLKPSPVIELRLVLEITNVNGGSLGGVMISVDQGNARIPVTTLTEKDGVVHLETRSIGGTFDGRLGADGSEMVGDWKQGGGVLPLVFKRLDKAPSFSRPQEPKAPYPYDEEEVVFENVPANVALAGTLTTPRSAGPHPAVVLISGSGPQDRDEAIMGHRPFLVLADHLTREGIGVLRYDDRGIGKSTGSFGAATHEDFVTDALAAVEWLKTRKEIDPKRIGLVGHSEGGIVAPIAAVKQPNDVSFIVLLAGVAVPMDELLVRQGQDIGRVMGADAETLEKSADVQRATFQLLKEKLDRPVLEKKLRDLFQQQMAGVTDAQREAMGYTDSMLEVQLQTVLTPWFQQLIAYDPRPTLREVKCPVLAINGEKDLQVAAEANLIAIREMLAAGGNTNVTTREFPGLNHLFQSCRTGAISEYGQIEETFNPEALAAVSEWIRRQTGLR